MANRSFEPPPLTNVTAGSHSEFLKSKDVYILDRGSSVLPYDSSKVRVVRSGVVPRPLGNLVGPDARRVLEDPRSVILKTDAELAELRDEDMPRPHTDLLLHDGRRLKELALRLASVGVLHISSTAASDSRRVYSGAQGRHAALGLRLSGGERPVPAGTFLELGHARRLLLP